MGRGNHRADSRYPNRLAAGLAVICCLLLAACGGVSLHAVFTDGDLWHDDPWHGDPWYEPIEFQVIAGTATSSINQARLVAVRDLSSWDGLWIEHTAGTSPPPSLPAINFTRHIVLAIFLGARPNSCYSVSVLSVTRRRGPERFEIAYRESGPMPGMSCATVVTHPATMIVIPYTAEPIEFFPVQ